MSLSFTSTPWIEELLKINEYQLLVMQILILFRNVYAVNWPLVMTDLKFLIYQKHFWKKGIEGVDWCITSTGVDEFPATASQSVLHRSNVIMFIIKLRCSVVSTIILVL